MEEALVHRYVTEEAKRFLQAPDGLSSAQVPGLNEFPIKKGQVCDPAMVGLEQRLVMGVVNGHRQVEVAAVLDTLPQPEKTKVVAMDMHEPFRQAVELCLPQAKVVRNKVMDEF
ncbi:MAG: transposase [Dehalococcoidia bacterium]